MSEPAGRPGRFIAAENLGAVSRWTFDRMDPAGSGIAAPGGADASTLAEVRAQGRAEGYAAGHAEALAQARAEMADFLENEARDNARRLAALFAAAEAGLAAAQQDIAHGTLELACALARQVLRRELATRTDALEPVVREALALLLADGRSVRVRLSPVDHAWLEASLRGEFEAQGVTLVADAAVAPGDCLVESASTVIDGSLGTRWSRAVASLGLADAWVRADGDAA